MTLCPLDAEYPIEVDVADSPMFADLVTHWGGQAENVTELQGHLYQEVIQLTQVRVIKHVFPPQAAAPKFTPTVQLEQTGPIAIVREDITYARTTEIIPAADQLDHMDTLEHYWREEVSRRRRWHRVRTFFSLVREAYHIARTS